MHRRLYIDRPRRCSDLSSLRNWICWWISSFALNSLGGRCCCGSWKFRRPCAHTHTQQITTWFLLNQIRNNLCSNQRNKQTAVLLLLVLVHWMVVAHILCSHKLYVVCITTAQRFTLLHSISSDWTHSMLRERRARGFFFSHSAHQIRGIGILIEHRRLILLLLFIFIIENCIGV